MENREQVRGKLLLAALEVHPNRAARPVWSWPERDKHSSIWLLCLPFPDSTLSSPEFSTAAASMLCIPPPCCAPHIGKTIQARLQVCKWGDNVVNATMRGDGFRTRHDATKLLLRDLQHPLRDDLPHVGLDLCLHRREVVSAPFRVAVALTALSLDDVVEDAGVLEQCSAEQVMAVGHGSAFRKRGASVSVSRSWCLDLTL